LAQRIGQPSSLIRAIPLDEPTSNSIATVHDVAPERTIDISQFPRPRSISHPVNSRRYESAIETTVVTAPAVTLADEFALVSHELGSPFDYPRADNDLAAYARSLSFDLGAWSEADAEIGINNLGLPGQRELRDEIPQPVGHDPGSSESSQNHQPQTRPTGEAMIDSLKANRSGYGSPRPDSTNRVANGSIPIITGFVTLANASPDLNGNSSLLTSRNVSAVMAELPDKPESLTPGSDDPDAFSVISDRRYYVPLVAIAAPFLLQRRLWRQPSGTGTNDRDEPEELRLRR
jgi:hypothetical protein